MSVSLIKIHMPMSSDINSCVRQGAGDGGVGGGVGGVGWGGVGVGGADGAWVIPLHPYQTGTF